MGRKRKSKNRTGVIGVIILIIAILVYAKLTILKDFNPDINFNFDSLFNKNKIEVSERSVKEDFSEVQQTTSIKEETVYLTIFFTKVSGNNDVYMAVTRKKPNTIKCSNFEYAIRLLLKGPTKYEITQGLATEIPSNTKLLGVKETPSKVVINLSDDFEFGGGGDSLYKRVYQIIKTANHNTRKPVYLYINGKQASVIGGEGLMIKQPLRNDSLEE